METPEVNLDCLEPLRIHRFSQTEMVAAGDDTVWLDGGLSVPPELDEEWSSLRESTRILKTSTKERVRMRQRRLFGERVLDTSGVLKLAAQSDRPDCFANLIMHFLASGTPSSSAIACLKEASWLRLNDRSRTAPKFILHLDGMEAIVTKVLSVIPDCPYYSSGDLPAGIRESKGWNTLATQVLPLPKQSLESLGELLVSLPAELVIGFKIDTIEELTQWLSVVTECADPNLNLFSARPLLAALTAKDSLRGYALQLADVMGNYFQGDGASSRYLERILALKQTYEDSQGEAKKSVIVVVAKYIGGARQAGCWSTLRQEPSLVLLSQSSAWKSPQHLAPPCAGIRKSALLHNTIAEALGLGSAPRNVPDPNESDGGDSGPEISDKESARAIRTLLGPFRERLQEKAVAILPALLGNDPETQALAAEMLGGISPTSIKDELIPDSIQVDDQIGGALRERSDLWSFRVQMIQGSTVTLESIAGSEFDAPLLDSSETVFLPNPNGQLLRWTGGNRQIICVAEPSRFESLSDGELRDLILESIRSFLWWAYVLKPSNLEEIFERCEGLGQMSLGVARQEILRSADTQLQILGIVPPGLEEARRLSTEARARLAEADSGMGNIARLRNEGETADKQARSLFLKRLDDNPEVQTALLNGVRRRIAQQQYELDSIPFEILQNADDAATELSNHTDISEIDTRFVNKFVLHRGPESISFHYGGRPINSACGLTGPDGDRYRRDLVKMLLLNGSDKNTGNDEPVTGCFGLGFKSVFLLSDQPRVSSGTLSFEIVGGIWPRAIDQELFQATDEIFGDYRQRTSVELDARPELIDRATSRFLSLAPWLPVFTRQLTDIIISSEGPSETYRWHGESLAGTEKLRCGTITTPEGARSHLELTDGEVQWLFQISDGQFVELPEDLPWLWVTAPTREKAYGFALNGPFALDPGRTRLSKQHEDVVETNRPLFNRAAALIRSEFDLLARSTEAMETLGVADRYRFWSSLWDLMVELPRTTKQPDSIEHLSAAIWPNDRISGYSGLINDQAIIPNGLSGPLRALTDLNALTYSIRGWFTSPAGSLLLEDTIIEELTPFEGPEACCSETVARQLHGRLEIELSSFGLIDLLTDNDRNEIRIPDKQAILLSKALWPDLGNCFEVDFDQVLTPSEAAELETHAESVRFLSEADTWESTENLLVTATHSPDCDEILRSGFAPPKRHLSSSYESTGVRLFLAFRRRLKADATEMAQWIRASNQDRLPKEALIYLAKGELRQELAAQLGPNWYRSIQNTSVFQESEPWIIDSISLVFDIAEKENQRRLIQGESGWDEPEPSPAPPPTPNPLSSSALEDCWDAQEAIELFTISGPLGGLVCGAQSSPNQLLDLLSTPDTLASKIAWYRFLCLGCTLGMPLGIRPLTLAQRLWDEDLTEDFWRATIPSSLKELEDSDFNTSLDAYFEGKIHMLFKNENASGENAAFWRRVFYDFRKMHYFVFRNHLPETIMEFSRYEEADGNRLINFLRSGRVPDDMQDPGTSRFRGVIGQSMKAPLLFVMRELRRLELFDDRFDPACFYMNSPARRTAHKLGWIYSDSVASGDFSALVTLSEKVHQCMLDELPDLAGYFDLPLQLYALKNPR